MTSCSPDLDLQSSGFWHTGSHPAAQTGPGSGASHLPGAYSSPPEGRQKCPYWVTLMDQGILCGFIFCSFSKNINIQEQLLLFTVNNLTYRQLHVQYVNYIPLKIPPLPLVSEPDCRKSGSAQQLLSLHLAVYCFLEESSKH